MNVGSQREKMKLYGFNNLTKTLSFNMYDICYTKTVEDRIAYIEYIDEQYNAERLTGILREVANIIGAQILNISVQDYEPQGSSVTILISDEGINRELESARADRCSADSVLLAHLDKSHLTVHTYPEYHPDGGVCTFRADIDVSTCGEISPRTSSPWITACAALRAIFTAKNCSSIMILSRFRIISNRKSPANTR